MLTAWGGKLSPASPPLHHLETRRFSSWLRDPGRIISSHFGATRTTASYSPDPIRL